MLYYIIRHTYSFSDVILYLQLIILIIKTCLKTVWNQNIKLVECYLLKKNVQIK